MERAVEALKKQGVQVNPDWCQYLAPLGWEHINLTGDYIWDQSKASFGLYALYKILSGVYILNSVSTIAQHHFKESKMKTIRRILCAVIVITSTAAVADWTAQNEQACDNSTAGQFKYYTLSLSWSPEFCRSHPSNKEPQCKQNREFIVHGLWPECGTGNPQRCAGGGVADVIDKEKIYAFMPSDFLIQHEWDTHGTCSGLARSAYFDLTGTLFGKLKFPRLSGAPKAAKIEALFMENNPGLDADDIYLSCTENGPKKSNSTLDEVRICFDKETLEFSRCEDARDTCQRLRKVTISRKK